MNYSDITYDNGFPANIDKTKLIVVQIIHGKQGVVLYSYIERGCHDRSYLPL